MSAIRLVTFVVLVGFMTSCGDTPFRDTASQQDASVSDRENASEDSPTLDRTVAVEREEGVDASVEVSTLTDDPRFQRGMCYLADHVNEDGECLPNFIFEEIYFGSLPADRDHFGNTVALILSAVDSTGKSHESLCSGSLISQSYVLSARHCLEPGEVQASTGWESVDWEITDVVFGLHKDLTEDPSQERIGVAHCLEYATTTPVKCQQSSLQPTDRDLVLVKLSSQAPIAPMRLAEVSWIDNAAWLVAVGFGLTEERGPNNERLLGLKQFAEIPMVSPSCSGFKNGNPDEYQYGCIKDIELVAGLGEHQGPPAPDTCGGDSGGTIYVIKQPPGSTGTLPQWPKDYFLAAATSRAIVGFGANPNWPHCGDGGVYVRVDADVQTWLRNSTSTSGEQVSIGR